MEEILKNMKIHH